MSDQKFDAFKDMMARNVRRLADRSGRYISRMSEQDRTWILAAALETAWSGIDGFNPDKMSLLAYWDVCMREAVLRRPVWPLRHLSGWSYVYTPQLIKSIKPIGSVEDALDG